MTKCVIFFLVLSCFIYVSYGLECFSCQGGFTTPCALDLPAGMTEDCNGPNAQCYEAIITYNNAVTYVERRCYKPGNNSTSSANFCRDFKNPLGKIKECRICKTDLCNRRPYIPGNEATHCYYGYGIKP